jgi:hypothetical protein
VGGEEALAGMRVQDPGPGYPTEGDLAKPNPGEPMALGAAPERMQPQPDGLTMEGFQSIRVSRDRVIGVISADHALEPLAGLGDRLVTPLQEFLMEQLQLGAKSLRDRLSPNREDTIQPGLRARVRKTQEVERFGFPFATPDTVFGRETTEFDQARLLGMEREAKLLQSGTELSKKSFGIPSMLKSRDKIVRVADDDDFAIGRVFCE